MKFEYEDNMYRVRIDVEQDDYGFFDLETFMQNLSALLSYDLSKGYIMINCKEQPAGDTNA